jgi:hypothetical protein
MCRILRRNQENHSGQELSTTAKTRTVIGFPRSNRTSLLDVMHLEILEDDIGRWIVALDAEVPRGGA